MNEALLPYDYETGNSVHLAVRISSFTPGTRLGIMTPSGNAEVVKTFQTLSHPFGPLRALQAPACVT